MIQSPKNDSRDTDVQVVELLRRDPLHVRIDQVRTLRKALICARERKHAGARLLWIERAKWNESAVTL